MEIFDAERSRQAPLLIDFYTEWCGSCQTMLPILEKIQTKLGNTFSLLQINIDKHPQVAAQFNIRNVPTFILMKNGIECWRKVGLVSSKELERQIQYYQD